MGHITEVFLDNTVLSHQKCHSRSFKLYGNYELNLFCFSGFYDDVWMGPQVLAHHLLLMLTVDLWEGSKPVENRFCPKESSILHQSVRPGKQTVDRCVIDKLNKSNVGIRPCLRDL